MGSWKVPSRSLEVSECSEFWLNFQETCFRWDDTRMKPWTKRMKDVEMSFRPPLARFLPNQPFNNLDISGKPGEKQTLWLRRSLIGWAKPEWRQCLTPPSAGPINSYSRLHHTTKLSTRGLYWFLLNLVLAHGGYQFPVLVSDWMKPSPFPDSSTVRSLITFCWLWKAEPVLVYWNVIPSIPEPCHPILARHGVCEYHWVHTMFVSFRQQIYKLFLRRGHTHTQFLFHSIETSVPLILLSPSGDSTGAHPPK